MLLARASEMQALDRCAINQFGIPGIVLMENAGRSTVFQICKQYGPCAGKSVPIFIGPGNNGGDGLVIARYILQQKGRPILLYLTDPEKLRGDAGVNQDIVSRLDLHCYRLKSSNDIEEIKKRLDSYHAASPVYCLVDALFGTGLARELEGKYLECVCLINELRKSCNWPVVAVDMPSGVNGDTGMIMGESVHADLTVTYGLPQPGHFLHGGPRIGTLKVIDIGIPNKAIHQIGSNGQLLTAKLADTFTSRKIDSHKGSHGHVALLAGEEGKTGATILAAKGALRIGAGLVSILTCEKLNPIFENALPEAMTVVLSGESVPASLQDYDAIVQHCAGKQALVIGPGLGTSKQVSELVLQLYTSLSTPMVVDADALNILAAHPEILAEPGGIRILTPHPGEMARLLGISNKEVQADRISCCEALLQAMQTNNVSVVLKGAGTIIMNKAGNWAINTSGNQGMATGGMGDVLAGTIGSLLCQGYSPWDSSCLAVYLHGRAADIVSRDTAGQGYLASEVADSIPKAITEFLLHRKTNKSSYNPLL